MRGAVSMPDASIITGRIVAVGTTIDPANRAIPARARLGASPTLMVGKLVMASLLGGMKHNGVNIPAIALTRIGERDVVFVRTGKGFAIRPVIVAGRANGQLFLSSGLSSGEHVAISGITEIKSVIGGV